VFAPRISPGRSAAVVDLFALALFLGHRLGFHRWIRMPGFAEQLGDGEVQFASCRIDAGDHYFYLIPDADFGAGALTANYAVFVVYVPPVIEKVFVSNQSVDEVGLSVG